MIAAEGSRHAVGRDADHRSGQRNQASSGHQGPAPPVRPVHLVRLQFPRSQVPATPDAACTSHDPELWFSRFPQAIVRRETYGIWGGTDFNSAHQEDVA